MHFLYHKDMPQISSLCMNVMILLAHLQSLGRTNDDIFGPDPISGNTPFCAHYGGGVKKKEVI